MEKLPAYFHTWCPFRCASNEKFSQKPLLTLPMIHCGCRNGANPVLTSFRCRSRCFVIGFHLLHQSLTRCQPDDINPNHCLRTWETERTWNYLGTVPWRKQLYLIWLNVETEQPSPSLSWKLTGLKQVVVLKTDFNAVDRAEAPFLPNAIANCLQC